MKENIPDLKKILKLFLIWRIWLFVPLLFGMFFLPFRENSLFTTILEYLNKNSILTSPLIYPWANFDGVHYLSIASRGYITEGRFLPLFPSLIYLVSLPFTMFWKLKLCGNLVFFSGLFLSNLFFVLSLLMFKKLLKLDYSEDFSNKTILSLIIFPTSFFFVSIYSESLFLFLSILILYLARKKKWIWVIILSMFLSITRLPGFLILIPVLFEFLNESKNKLKINLWKILIISSKFFIILFPLFFYILFNYYKWGDPLFFINNHASLGNNREVNSLVFPLITIYRYLKIFFTVSIKQYEFWVAIAEFISFILASFGLWFAIKKRVRSSYLLFAFLLLLLPILSGTLTGFPRYLLIAFPIFIGFADKINLKKSYWKILIFISLLLQSLLLALFSRGWFIA